MTNTADIPLIDIRPDHWAIVRDILQRHVPHHEVWAFGSRAKWTAKTYSDLDLAVISEQPLTLSVEAALADDFSESDLPWKVDVVDWATTSESFRGIIGREKVVVQRGGEGSRPVVRTLKLGDNCEKIGSGATPRGGKETYSDDGPVSLIRSQNIHNDRFSHGGLAFISQEQAAQLQNVEVKECDVLLNITGDSVARACQVDREVLPARVNQHVAIIRPIPNQIDARFLRYFLITPTMQAHMLGLAAAGATRNALTKAMIEGFQVPAWSVENQRAIASILGPLDDKIELNRRMNETLEEMARAVFKSWFVDFDPVHAKAQGRSPAHMPPETAAHFPARFNGEGLPEGWRWGQLDELLVLQRGFDLPAIGRVEGQFPVFAAGGFHGNHNEFKVKAPGVVTGRSGVIGNVYLIQDDFWPLNTTLWVKEFRRAGAYYSYQILRTIDLSSFNVGSAVPSLNRNHIHNYPVCIPLPEAVSSYELFTEMMFKKIKANADQNITLAALRDLLLPKLMSGEMRLAKAQTLVEET